MPKVLIVDDDLNVRQLYEEVLKNNGLEVDIAVDGDEGLKKIRAGSYSVVLLDIMMPKLDGIGLLTKLTTEDPKPAVMPSIIVLTNLAHDPAIQEAVQKGASTVLVKSDVTPDQIVSEVKKHLSASTPSSSTDLPNQPVDQES